MKKIKDLAVKVGEYTDRNGNKKGKWQNIGVIMQDDKGGEMMLIERWFNPAGVPNPDNRSSIIVSRFDPKEPGVSQTAQAVPAAQPPETTKSDIDDEIPF